MSNIINYIKTQCVVLYFIGFFGYYNLQKIKDISNKPMQIGRASCRERV